MTCRRSKLCAPGQSILASAPVPAGWGNIGHVTSQGDGVGHPGSQEADILVTGTLGLAYPQTGAGMRRAVELATGSGKCTVRALL